MSILFLAEGARLWNPSNTPGRLFKGQAEVVSEALGLPSGLGEIMEDWEAMHAHFSRSMPR